MTWTAPDFDRILAEMTPYVGDHDLAWNWMRWAEKKGGKWPKHVNSLLKRTWKTGKPYGIVETAVGLRFFVDRRDRYARTNAIDPDYEVSTAAPIIQSLRERPGAYVDVGANMGILAAMVAREFPNLPVVAVEPVEETARRAACTFALNGLQNVTLHVAAVGDHDGEVSFFAEPGSSDAASLSRETLGEAAREIKVPLRTIDTLCADLSQPVGFLKIDVEGHEPAAIQGALRTIERDHPAVFFEFHWDIAPALGWTAEQVAAAIESTGRPYRFVVAHHDDPVRPFPPTRDMGLALNIWAQPIA